MKIQMIEENFQQALVTSCSKELSELTPTVI